MDADDYDLLAYAITNNKKELAKELLAKGCTKTENYLELVKIGYGYPKNKNINGMLLECGGGIQKVMEMAVLVSDAEAVEVLSENGAIATPELLSDAVLGRHIDTVRALLEAGADPNVRVDESLPIEKALKDDQMHIVKLLLQYTKPALVSKIDNIRVREYLPGVKLSSIDNQIDACEEDLKGYSNDDIRMLAGYMGIDCESNTCENLCREMAKKLVYVHSKNGLRVMDAGKCKNYKKKFDKDDIAEIREKIYKKYKKYKDSVADMPVEDLCGMFNMYDELCFGGDIKAQLGELRYTLKFEKSGEDTFTTQGICARGKCAYTITIPVEYFNQIEEGGVTNVAGHKCHDQLECLQRVIEHELAHLVIFVFCRDEFVSGEHGELFMKLVGDLFGHTDHRHYIF